MHGGRRPVSRSGSQAGICFAERQRSRDAPGAAKGRESSQGAPDRPADRADAPAAGGFPGHGNEQHHCRKSSPRTIETTADALSWSSIAGEFLQEHWQKLILCLAVLLDRGQLDGGCTPAAGRSPLVAAGQVLAGDGGHPDVRGPGDGPDSLGCGARRSNDAGHDADRGTDPFHGRRRAETAAGAIGLADRRIRRADRLLARPFPDRRRQALAPQGRLVSCRAAHLDERLQCDDGAGRARPLGLAVCRVPGARGCTSGSGLGTESEGLGAVCTREPRVWQPAPGTAWLCPGDQSDPNRRLCAGTGTDLVRGAGDARGHGLRRTAPAG